MTLTVSDIKGGMSRTKLNKNFKDIEDYINDHMLNRSGLSGGESNEMGVSLDMNNHQVLNVHVELAGDELQAVNKKYVDGAILNAADGAQYVIACVAAKDAAELAQLNTEGMYTHLTEFLHGSGVTLPSTGVVENSLFYYAGPLYETGLYAYNSAYSEPDTGVWKLVSGVGPQGPIGPEGIQGAQGLEGPQGIQGVDGPQGPRGLEGPIGDTGPQGLKGETGVTGPQGPQGVEGPTGPLGPQGPQGIQGVLGPTGPTGAIGPQGNDGDSFQIDAFGTLVDRDGYDSEAKDFTYYATDYSVSANTTPNHYEVIATGSVSDYVLPFVPDGPQSLAVSVGGVLQAPDKYVVDIQVDGNLAETYTIQFPSNVESGLKIVIREFSISTGYGAIYIKQSASLGDWGPPIPFGKGPRGDQGVIGPEGPTGPTGPQGVVGPEGPTGPQGPVGVQGPQGATGETGAQGIVGPQGDRGPRGIQGDQGIVGQQGPQGEQGVTGATGPQGAQGATGATGPRGSAGPTGPQGAKGETGDQGSQGIRGSRAFYLSGRTSWSASVATVDIGTVIERDTHTQYDDTIGFSETRSFVSGDSTSPSNWAVVEKVVNFIPVVIAGVDSAIGVGGGGAGHFTLTEKNTATTDAPANRLLAKVTLPAASYDRLIVMTGIHAWGNGTTNVLVAKVGGQSRGFTPAYAYSQNSASLGSAYKQDLSFTLAAGETEVDLEMSSSGSTGNPNSNGGTGGYMIRGELIVGGVGAQVTWTSATLVGSGSVVTY